MSEHRFAVVMAICWGVLFLIPFAVWYSLDHLIARLP